MEALDHDPMAPSHSSSSTGYPDPAPAAAVLKRKRSRRPPPLPRALASSSSASSADTAVSAATEEEEDMAHCLILLAQGRGLLDSSSPFPPLPPPLPSPEKFTSRKFTETTTTAGGKAGFYVYECKTCNKCFPSFQALGGHRASHKKPKLSPTIVVAAGTSTADEKIQIADTDHGVEGLDTVNSNAFSITKPNAAPAVAAANSPTGSKMRVHECSICGAEFSSGQALGGHMRRHRPIGATPEQHEPKKERNVLSLDLNLPAPSDDSTLIAPPPVAAPFSFPNKRTMVFSATSALVDCHY